MRGKLQKRSSSVPHKWQERHFELAGKRLVSRKDAKPSRPVHKEYDLSLPNTLAFSCSKNEREIELHVGQTLVVLRAETPEKAKEWVESI